MKWVRIKNTGDGDCFGVLEDGKIKVSNLSWSEILAGKTPVFSAEASLDQLAGVIPMGLPGKIIAVGLNYHDHCRETGLKVPKEPVIFSKFTTCLVGSGADIGWDANLTDRVDYEAELAVIMGSSCRQISADVALDHVFGYSAANDVSARDLQFGDQQWVRSKSLDTFGPIGPVVVSKDEIDDPQNLEIRCLLNGQVMQQSNTREMIFSVRQIVSFCSQAFTLQAGDVILTGTPQGVGFSRKPPVYLQHGDEVVVEIEKIGQLRNHCVVYGR